MSENSFLKKFQNEKIWILWRLELNKDKKWTKVPYFIENKHASTADPTTWLSYAEAKKETEIRKYDGFGFIFEKSAGIIGVDLDHCIENSRITDPAYSLFVKEAKTYCEFSPSKTGLHILFQTKESFVPIKNKKNFEKSSVEIYTWGRYFTFTGNEHPDSKKIRTVTEEEFSSLLSLFGYPWDARPVIFVPEETIPYVSPFPDDKKLLEKMFSSKNGEKIKKLYNGDISGNNNDASSADIALCMHLAFWTGKNSKKICSLWLASPLGKRQKTQKRKDYQDRTIQRALEYTIDIYSGYKSPVNGQKCSEKEFLFSGGKDPAPHLIMENICRLLKNDSLTSNRFRLNDFSHMVETCYGEQEWINLNDGVILALLRYISTEYSAFRKLSKQMLTEAVIAVAHGNKINPPKDYLTSLVWDGIPRLNSWLHKTYGVPDDELHQSMGSNWLKGLVKRVMRPGCIFDEVLALESPQGWRKSTSIRELGRPWHVETTHNADDKDFYMILAQNIIVEFSEGEIFDRTSVKKLKAEVTKTEDQFRPPYERGMLTFKRSCVFAVTTNKLELKDDTGNRRWLPVSLERPADIPWLKENRGQLFAEAYTRVIVNGETTHEYPKETLEALQESRGEWSDNDEILLLWYAKLPKEKQEEGISLLEACGALFKENQRIDKLEELRTASILRRTLHLENKNKKIHGAVLKRWFPTQKTFNKIKEIDTNEFF